jgi:hypothetical protein
MVSWDTLVDILTSSSLIRLKPQSGFSFLSLRIKSFISFESGGLPLDLCLLDQYLLKTFFHAESIVSGETREKKRQALGVFSYKTAMRNFS